MSLIKKKYKYKYKLFFLRPPSESKTIVNENKNLQNIFKSNQLKIKNMKSLMKKSSYTKYNLLPFTTSYDNSVNTYNNKNLFLRKSSMMQTQKCNKILKKLISPCQSKLKIHKYSLKEPTIYKNFSKSRNKQELLNKNQNTPSISKLLNLALNPKSDTKESTRKLIKELQKGKLKLNAELLDGRILKRSSQIDRLLFQYLNPTDCFEDYLADCKPSDKFKFFKKQLEKKRTSIESNLVKLKLPLE